MLGIVVGIIHLILFVIAASDIMGSSKPIGAKILWLLLIFFLPVIGLIIYYVAGRGS